MATYFSPSHYASSPLNTQLRSPSAAASDRHRPASKRRLTSQPEFQAKQAVGQANKKVRLMQAHDEVHILDDVDELIPQFRAMGEDTTLFTPQTGGFDGVFVPFVLDDGVLSFYTPSPDSSDPGPSFSPPSSSASDASFLGVLPDQPRHGRLNISPVFQGLSIWRGGDESPAHMYAQTINRYPSRDTAYLGSLDPSFMRYDPVHTAIAQLPCHFTHVDVPLVVPSSATVDEPHTMSSMLTISAPRQSPVRLKTAVYDRGALSSSYEAQMEEGALLHPDGALYSAPLPQKLVDELSETLGRDDESDAALALLDRIAVLQFVQQEEQPDSDGKSGEEVVLVVVCDFRALKATAPGEVQISHLIAGNAPSDEVLSPPSFLPTPPSSRERLADQSPPSSFSSRPRSLNRLMPKLSVAIPPSTMGAHGAKGRIQLCSSDSPSSTLDSSISRPTPQTGVPHNVFPVTPFEQLIHTPLYPPEIPRSTARSRAGYPPTPTESAYPFTLATSSPGVAPSPAFAVLDPAIGPGRSAPAWLTLPRNATPLTPSFFLQQPHSAAASNAMSSITQRALDAGTPTLPALLRKAEYFSPPLAAPHSIASAPVFAAPHVDTNLLRPATATGWPAASQPS